MSLTVGDVAESVEVTAETPLLSTAEASLGQVVDERRVLELPIFSGNAMEFTLLAPGTVNGTDMRLRKAPFNNAPSQFSTDGSGLFNNEFTIDGITNTFSDSANVRVAFSPPQSSIGEFKVQTSSFDASQRPHHGFGRSTSTARAAPTSSTVGVLVAAPFRSGRSHDFPEPRRAAQDFHLPGQPLRPFRRRPRLIPKVYNGKNKTFWIHVGSQQVRRPERRHHHFHRAARGVAQRRSLRPAEARAPTTRSTIRPPSRPRRTARSPAQLFPGNIIPASRLDPVGKAIMNLYPLPNQPGNADGTQQLSSSPARRWKITGRRSAAWTTPSTKAPHVRSRPPRFLAGRQEPQLRQRCQRHHPEPHQSRHRLRRRARLQSRPSCSTSAMASRSRTFRNTASARASI